MRTLPLQHFCCCRRVLLQPQSQIAQDPPAGSHECIIALLKGLQQEGQGEGWVFPSDKSRSGHIELSGLEHMFRKVARKLGIPDSLKLYCARHTFGTVAMAETRNPGLVKDVMGHESLNTTMGYLHPEVLQIKQVIDRRNQEKEDGQ